MAHCRLSPRFFAATLLVQLAITGCSDDWGQPDGGTGGQIPRPDAATTDPGPGADASLEGAVTGTVIRTYRSADGTEHLPDELLSAAALVENRDGSFDRYPGVDRGEGQFAVPDVPDEPFYLTVDGRDYVHTSARELDLGDDVYGRPDTAWASTSIELELAGLEPWEVSDDLELHAPNAGVSNSAIKGELEPEPSYADEVIAATWNYQDSEIDAERGDRAYLTQTRLESVNDIGVFSPVAFLEVSDLTIRESGGARIEATLSPVAADAQLAIDWRLSEFAALGPEIAPGSPDLLCLVEVIAIPGQPGRDHEILQPRAATALEDCDRSDALLEAAYADPYPESWSRYGEISTTADERADLDGLSWLRTVTVSHDAPLDALESEPVAPQLSPVRYIRVNGFEATEPLEDVSTAPVITWNDPRIGEATGYVLTVYRLDPNGSSITQNAVADIVTTDLRVRIPPGVMEPDEVYAIEIAAVREPGIDLATTPYREGFPGARAERLTPALRP